MFLKISQILQGKAYVEATFNKVAGLKAYKFTKRDSSTGIFFVNLRSQTTAPMRTNYKFINQILTNNF